MKLFHPYDVTVEAEMLEPLDFSRRNRMQHVDRLFKAEITSITRLTATEKLFHIRLLDPGERERFSFLPGQFVMVELPGYGEVPISISGSTLQRGMIELCIRAAGRVTGLLHRARRGARIGIRGPFGSYFPLSQMKGRDVFLIAGGLGLAPLRSAILYVTEHRADFGDVQILYGTSRPSELLFDYQYEQWRRVDEVALSIIVDQAEPGWDGPVGRITELLPRLSLSANNAYAIVCGPPVMFKHVCNWLSEHGLPMHRMFVSLERRMHCGMGKCCRCNVGSTFTCIEGPVFDYWSVINLKEAI